MSGHTPGPWEWKPHGEGYTDYGLYGPNGEEIADDGSAWGEYKQAIDPNGANARLIAAAPEMYEALVYARNVLPNDKWADDARGIIVATIAKAEGR